MARSQAPHDTHDSDPLETSTLEVSFTQGNRVPAARRRRDLSRRGHPRHHQGAAAVGRGLRGRLPGRAGVAPARRDGAGQALHGRARRARGGLLQRSLGRGHAGRVHPLPAARRGHLEVHRRHQRGGRCAVQPGLARRHRRRADRGGRGLRRRRQRDPGAHPRLRAQVEHGAARSAARPGRAWCDMVEQGFRLSEASNMPAHDGAAHPRLPRARQLRPPRTTSSPRSRTRT